MANKRILSRRIGAKKQVQLSKRFSRPWGQAKRLENRRIDRSRPKQKRGKF
ncbi:MAG: hypothetical protein AAB897_00015 [Patescibacteria group bacterium]